MSQQLLIGQEPVETGFITVRAGSPLDVFKQIHRLSYFTECCDRLPDGRILWNEQAEEVYSEQLAEVTHYMLETDILESACFELPLPAINTLQEVFGS